MLHQTFSLKILKSNSHSFLMLEDTAFFATAPGRDIRTAFLDFRTPVSRDDPRWIARLRTLALDLKRVGTRVATRVARAR